jgi:hypothetical protein
MYKLQLLAFTPLCPPHGDFIIRIYQNEETLLGFSDWKSIVRWQSSRGYAFTSDWEGGGASLPLLQETERPPYLLLFSLPLLYVNTFYFA